MILHQKLSQTFQIAAVAVTLGFTHSTEAALFSYYVGVDGQATIPTGAYAGLASHANKPDKLPQQPRQSRQSRQQLRHFSQ